MTRELDVAIIGGGQAALAVGYHLRRTGLTFEVLDAGAAPGGGWRSMWPSLRLFSPAQWSSLPGWLMRGGVDAYPTRDDAIEYLTAYEERYQLPVRRPVRIAAVMRDGDRLRLRPEAAAPHSDDSPIRARAVVSATGGVPRIPRIPGSERFAGLQLHSSEYSGPASLARKRVVVVGGGNSGAQIVSELAPIADVTWATLRPPTFLPDDIDGRYLFDQATVRWKAKQAGLPVPPPASLGDVVAVPEVRAARDRGHLRSVSTFWAMTDDGVVWQDGREEWVDAVVWCTGFRPALDHLAPLGVIEADGRVTVEGTRSVAEPRLWLVGYGEWTGYASATLIGVGRSARATVEEISSALHP